MLSSQLNLYAGCRSSYPFPIFRGLQPHDLGWRTILFQEVRHDSHRAVHMLKKSHVAIAKIIQARLSVWCMDETVLRAATVVGKEYFALTHFFTAAWRPCNEGSMFAKPLRRRGRPRRERLLPGHSDAHTLFWSYMELLVAEIDPHPVDFAVEDAVLDVVVVRG